VRTFLSLHHGGPLGSAVIREHGVGDGNPAGTLELRNPDQSQEAESSSTLDFLVVQESGPAVATCRVEMDLEAGMNKVVVPGVPSTADCGGAELLSGTVPFRVASAAMDRDSGELVFDVEVETAAHAVFTAVYPFQGSRGVRPTTPRLKQEKTLPRFGHGIRFEMIQIATLHPQGWFLQRDRAIF